MPEIVSKTLMRRTETPNAVMTTLASPTQGPTAELSVWRVEMRAGQQGPAHVFDREQVWHAVSGAFEVATPEGSSRLQGGDAVVLPAGLRRQITAVTDVEMVVCGRADAVASVPGETTSRGTPAWVC